MESSVIFLILATTLLAFLLLYVSNFVAAKSKNKRIEYFNKSIIEIDPIAKDWPIVGVSEAYQEIIDSKKKRAKLFLSDSSSIEVQEVLDALIERPDLEEIAISGSCVGDLGAALISASLLRNDRFGSVNMCQLKVLDLRNAVIGDAGVDAIATSLVTLSNHLANTRQSCQLSELDLGYNSITDIGCVILVKAISIARNVALYRLSLKSNRISDSSARSIAKHILANETGPAIWDLSANSITSKGAAKIAEALPHNTWVTELHLAWNRIDVQGFEAFAQSIWGQDTLELLDLSFNTVGKWGPKIAAFMSEACLQSGALNSLGLGGMDISDVGMSAICTAIEKNASIQSLNLAASGIGSTGIRALADTLRENTSLTSIDLSGNVLADRDVKVLAQAMAVNSTLKVFKLDFDSQNRNGRAETLLNVYLQSNDAGIDHGLVDGLIEANPEILDEKIDRCMEVLITASKRKQ